MSINSNKGEWSELYAFIYLLATGKLYSADQNANIVRNSYFPVLKIYREEDNCSLEFSIVNSDDVLICRNSVISKTVSRNDLNSQAATLYRCIKSGGASAFPIPAADQMMSDLLITKVKAPSSDKTDIKLMIHDIMTNFDVTCGFSIKSELGSPPHLLNASEATNFIYRVDGLSDSDMNRINLINSRSKIIDRINAINSIGSISFDRCNNEVFDENLQLIDSRMPEFIGKMLLISYSTGVSSCLDVLKIMAENDVMNYRRNHFYNYKFKQLLTSVALGMVPSKEWSGHDEANGGYIIVTRDGDVIAYYLYNRDQFAEYLLKSTKLERGSTSRHKFASLYKDNGQMYIKLNLAIRFKG